MFQIAVSDDGRYATLHPDNAPKGRPPFHMDADQISALIAQLAEARARMMPAFTGTFVPGQTRVHPCDNLLWEVAPAPSRRGLALGFFNQGIGWVSIHLSRAQIEDLLASIEFSLAELVTFPGPHNLRQGPNPPAAAAEPVPLRRSLTGTRS